MNRCALTSLLLAGVFIPATASISLNGTAATLRGEGMTTRVSLDSSGRQANDASWSPAISADGRFVAYQSYASNLVADDSNTAYDIFVHDRLTGATTRVLVESTGWQANGSSGAVALSADGRYATFSSQADDLVLLDTNGVEDIFVHDLGEHPLRFFMPIIKRGS